MMLPWTKSLSCSVNIKIYSSNFLDLNGIIGDLGVMKITFKLDMKPYSLNPKYKEKVQLDLDKMLEAGIIEPVGESDWVSPMVVQEKK